MKNDHSWKEHFFYARVCYDYFGMTKHRSKYMKQIIPVTNYKRYESSGREQM